MIPKRVVIIFPKLETYEFKHSDYKFHMREQARRRVQYYVDNEILSLYCFAEDELAVKLLPEVVNGRKPINYMSCFNSVDKVIWNRISSETASVVSLYKDVYLTDIINKTAKKTVAKQDAGANDNSSYVQILNIKKRMTVSEFLSSPEYIILYFDKNNQYCNLPDTAIGDLRVVHRVNLNEDSDTYCFSGQYIDEELFKRVIEEG